MKKRVIIVGGVAGGASTAARLRRLDQEAEITIYERGEYISYANCGLPYHIGNVIKSRDALLLQTPQVMKSRFNIDVHILHEVIAINRNEKTVSVKNLKNQEVTLEKYDTLVIATGSSPVIPKIPGIQSKRILSLWTVHDTDDIRKYIQDNKVDHAAVIGGGFIGVEMAENLRHRDMDVTLIEMMNQVMTPFDYEMAQLIHESLEHQGVHLHLGDGVDSFEESDDSVLIHLKSGKQISAQMVILSIGIKPNNELAKNCGLEINDRGGIVVDDMLHTSDPDIYAVGDVIEVEDFIDKSRTMIPLAGPANKQGRIAANNIAGEEEHYQGTQGSSIIQIFDLTAANTGANEKTLIKRGLVKGKDYESLIIVQNSHAGYYPGAVPMTMKLLFSKEGNKIFGAQIIGKDGVDKRIDTIGTAIRLGGTIWDLKSLEFAYAPPYSSAKDPVNMAGFVAENVLKGRVFFSEWDAIEKRNSQKTAILDVREEAEVQTYAIPGAINIPLGQLRSRISELNKDSETIVFCAIGVRAYNAARILMEQGFSNVKIYPGGIRFYRATHYEEHDLPPVTHDRIADSGHSEADETPAVSFRLDCSGMQCPGPIMKVFETMKDLEEGKIVEVSASDPGFARDIDAWSRRTGNTILSNEKKGTDYVALIRKGSKKSEGNHEISKPDDGKTIIVFSGDMDKAIASFIIANGAAAMGRPVTMFFTFWGLNVLRKPEKVAIKKNFIESMFGMMMPRGTKQLTLSKMNMGGIGTAMIKKIMNDKNVDALEVMIQKAKQAGVKLVACTMSMDLMGIKEEELIEGVNLGGVGSYLGDAEESNVNLFI